MRMFSHITIGVNDVASAVEFYDAVMRTLGYERHTLDSSFAGYGHPDDTTQDSNSLWILQPTNGQPASGGNGTNIALNAPDRKSVREFYNTALALGAADDGAPGIRAEAHPDFYAAYVIDQDGNKLVAVCHQPEND